MDFDYTSSGGIFLSGNSTTVDADGVTHITGTVEATLGGSADSTPHITATGTATLSGTARSLPTLKYVPDGRSRAFVAIYRESTGGEDEDSDTLHDETFDTTVREDEIYEIQGDRTNVRVLEPGRYFVWYNLMFQASTTVDVNSRTLHLANLQVNDTDISAGHSSGYIRGLTALEEECMEAYLSGGAILNLNANDDIKVVAKNNTLVDYTDVTRRADLCGLMLFKLNNDLNICRLKVASGGTDYNNTSFTDFIWDSQEEVSTQGFEHTAGESGITLKEAGHYLVTYNIKLQVTSPSASARRQFYTTRLTIDDTAVEQSYSGTYIRGFTNVDVGVASGSCIIETSSANQVLNLQLLRDSTRGQTTTAVSDECAINIVKLPTASAYVRIHESTGDQSLDTDEGVPDVITFDTNDEIDSPFTHSASSSTEDITANKSGCFLVTAGMYASHDTLASPERYCTRFDWQVNSTDNTYGGFGQYYRGTEPNEGGDSYETASSGAAILVLTEDDVVNLTLRDESVSDNNEPELVGNAYGVTGVYLDGIISGITLSGSAGASVAYSTTAAGGAVLSGKSPVALVFVPSGGITLSGSAAVEVGREATGSGGIVLSGGAIEVSVNYSYPASGTATLGGAADPTQSFTPTGGVIIGGSTIVTEASYSETASGSITLGGSPVIEQTFEVTASGGVVLGGSASNIISYTPTDGVVLGGTAITAVIYGGFAGGGIGTLGGAAPNELILPHQAAGGISLSGAAVTNVIHYTPSGSIVIGGSFTVGDVIRSTISTSGTITLEGSGDSTPHIVATGGMSLSGDAVERATKDFVGSGEIILGGTPLLKVNYGSGGTGGPPGAPPPIVTDLGIFGSADTTPHITPDGEITLSGAATVGNVVFGGYTPTGSVILGGSSPVPLPVEVEILFTWKTQSDVFRYFRVLSNCTSRTGGLPVQDTEDCTQGSQMNVTVAARSVREVCEKLVAANLIFPVNRIDRYSLTVRPSDNPEGTDLTKNVMTDVTDEFLNSGAECISLFLDVDALVEVEAKMELVKEDFSGTVTGTVTLSGSSPVVVTTNESTEFSTHGTGGLILSGESPAAAPFYSYIGSGTITLSNEQRVFSYTGSGGIDLSGLSESIIAGTNSLDVQAEAIATATDAGVFAPIEADLLESPDDLVTTICCPATTSPLSLYFNHNIARSTNLSQFLNRNNFTLDTPVLVYKSSLNGLWQGNQNFTGTSVSDNQQQSWNMIFEFGCNTNSTTTDSTYWKLAISVIKRNLSLGNQFVTKVVMLFNPATVCDSSASIDFNVNFNVLTLTTTPSTAVPVIFSDGIKMFQSREWTSNPNLIINVSAEAQPAIETVNYPEIFLPISIVRGASPTAV